MKRRSYLNLLLGASSGLLFSTPWTLVYGQGFSAESSHGTKLVITSVALNNHGYPAPAVQVDPSWHLEQGSITFSSVNGHSRINRLVFSVDTFGTYPTLGVFDLVIGDLDQVGRLVPYAVNGLVVFDLSDSPLVVVEGQKVTLRPRLVIQDGVGTRFQMKIAQPTDINVTDQNGNQIGVIFSNGQNFPVKLTEYKVDRGICKIVSWNVPTNLTPGQQRQILVAAELTAYGEDVELTDFAVHLIHPKTSIPHTDMVNLRVYTLSGSQLGYTTFQLPEKNPYLIVSGIRYAIPKNTRTLIFALVDLLPNARGTIQAAFSGIVVYGAVSDKLVNVFSTRVAGLMQSTP